MQANPILFAEWISGIDETERKARLIMAGFGDPKRSRVFGYQISHGPRIQTGIKNEKTLAVNYITKAKAKKIIREYLRYHQPPEVDAVIYRIEADGVIDVFTYQYLLSLSN